MSIERRSFVGQTAYFLSRLEDVTREKGIGHVLSFGTHWITSPLFVEYFKRRRKGWGFQLAGERYDYFCHRYNTTWRNERAVEVPIAERAVAKARGKRILEVGNVLSHYLDFEHDVLDKYERAGGVINEDVVDFKPSQPYDLIVSISTLEHVGWDETPRDADKVPRALAAMTSWLAPGGEILVTFPTGYNADLDSHLERGNITFTERLCMKRVSRDNRWAEVGWDEIKNARCNEPFPGYCTLVVGILRKPS